jgi:Zn finger protein HypA/HybF involved in hydrogenase expression
MKKERKKRSRVWSVSSVEFKDLVKKSSTISQILKHFGLANKGGNHNTVKRRIKHENIDISHITLGKGCNKGKKLTPRKSDVEFFCENSTTNRNHIKQRIIRNNLIKYECSECGLGEIWNGKKIVLQLEHKNGISNDNRLENLTFLCPNCHSQTDTFSGRRNNKVAKIKKGKGGPKPWLRRVERPTKEKLEELVEKYPMTKIGKMYDVSDNAVRKWIKYYNSETRT